LALCPSGYGVRLYLRGVTGEQLAELAVGALYRERERALDPLVDEILARELDAGAVNC
jgi:hypothetical protein